MDIYPIIFINPQFSQFDILKEETVRFVAEFSAPLSE